MPGFSKRIFVMQGKFISFTQGENGINGITHYGDYVLVKRFDVRAKRKEYESTVSGFDFGLFIAWLEKAGYIKRTPSVEINYNDYEDGLTVWGDI